MSTAAPTASPWRLRSQTERSLASLIASDPQLEAELRKNLTPAMERLLPWRWDFLARPSQMPPPGSWKYWLIKAGRGFGKTRAGGEWVREQVKHVPLVNLIGATADDARDIMIEGESGLLSICPKWERPLYRKSDRQLIWPNGAKSLIFTADEPERLRGKQHQRIWADELGSWRYAKEAWEQVTLGLRLPPNPQACITTTPRVTPTVKELLADPECVVTQGTSYDNEENLDPSWFRQIIRRYEGTRLGRQELLAELLDDNPGALWKRSYFDDARVARFPELERVVVGVDPAVTDTEASAETGIVVAGRAGDEYYILGDRSLRSSPRGWAMETVSCYSTHTADRVVGEVNNGGDMIEALLRTVDPNVSYKSVRATRGKQIRAEPVASLYEQGRVHHVGTFPQLEDQCCEWDPMGEGPSPDRMDALVWAITELMGEVEIGWNVW